MNRGTKRTVVRIAPTRDGFANPSERFPTKHTGLLSGKTCDEWWAIQSWASKEITLSILIGETPEHCERIKPLVEPYGVIVLCRPETMNHSSQDSGGFPTWFGFEYARKYVDNINYVIPDFVVNPLRKPDDYDRMIRAFDKKMASPNPDAVGGSRTMMSACRTDLSYHLLDGDRLVPQYVSDIGNSRYWLAYATVATLSISTTGFYEWMRLITEAGSSQFFPGKPWLFEIEEWQELHMDHPDQWDLAEFWFDRKIGGIEAYRDYRKTWE